MKFLDVVTRPPAIYHGWSNRRHSGKRSSHRWTWQVVVGAMLGNTGISIMVSNKLSCTYFLILNVCTRGKSPLQNQSIILEYQVRGWLTLWISGPKDQTRNKKQGFPLLTLLNRISGSCSRSLIIHLIWFTKVNRFTMKHPRINY